MVTQINQYKVLRHVARTGLSDVFEAESPQGRRVCIKCLLPGAIGRAAEDLLALKHEASVLSTVRHENVMEVIEFGEHNGQPFLALEWIEGGSLAELIQRGPLTQLDAVEVVLQVTAGLNAIHEKNLLHRDLKPDNIMVERSDSGCRSKIADFGLAGKTSEGSTTFVGTLSYVSPEQAGLVDWPVEATSDLYSMGVILYECVAGAAPFVNSDASALLVAHLSQKPPPLNARVDGLHPLLERIVMKLLEKEPGKRYRSAKGLHTDLLELKARLKNANSNADFELDLDVPAFERVRNVFVGRSGELEKLNQLFQKARRGQFGISLVSGVAGAGKSSLLREFENRSLIDGAKFAYGKCYEFSRALPYFCVSEALANLLLRLKLLPEASRRQIFQKIRESLGDLAGELVQLVPAFAEIFPNTKPVKYQGEGKQQEAIRELFIRLLRSLAQKGSPLVFILDDLQWADRALLDLLGRLAQMGFDCPVLVVGTYRSEEVNSEHALARLIEAKSAAVSTVSIGPLERTDVRLLIARALGVAEEGHDKLDTFVSEKAKGNPLFSIELIKALLGDQILAVEGSQLRFNADKAETRKLPDTIVEMVLKRLSGLSPEKRRMAGHAALIGTAFEFEQLQSIVDDPPDQIHSALMSMLSEQVLKLNRNKDYAFFHDKIHEACRNLVSEADRPAVHSRYLQYLKSLPETPDSLFAMAGHAIRGGDAKQIVDYCARAGAIALAKNANDDAFSYFSQAEKALQSAEVGSDQALQVQFNLAECLSRMGRYADARVYFTHVLKHSSAGKVLASQAQAKIAECFQREGKHEESKAELYSALASLGFKIRSSQFWFPILLDRMGILLFTLLRQFRPRSEARKEMDLAVTGVLKRLWMVHVVNDTSRLTHISYRLLFVASKIGVSEELALAYQYLSFSLANSSKPNIPLGLKYARRAVDLARQVEAHEVLAGSLVRIAAYNTWQGKSTEALEYSEKAREMLMALGNLWDVGNAIIFSYFAHRTLGFLDKALASANSLVKLSEETGSKGMMASGRAKVAEVFFMMNRFDEGEEQIKLVYEVTKQNKLTFDYFQALKVYGYASLYKGRLTDAKELFGKAVDILEKSGRSILAAYRNDAYLGWCEALLRSHRATPIADGELTKVSHLLATAERTEIFYRDIGHVYRLQAWFAFLTGKPALGLKLFDRAFDKFRAQERPIDAALAESDLALLTAKENSAGAIQALKRAVLTFGQSGAELHVERCTALLKELGVSLATTTESMDRQKAERLSSALLEISVASVSSLDPMDQARALLDKTIHLLKAERAILFTVDESKKLAFTIGRNVDRADLPPSDGYSTTIVNRVASSKEPLVVAGTADGVLMGAHSIVEKNLLSMMAAPILLNEQLMGVLYIDNKMAHGIYREDDASFLQAISKHIAVALEVSRAAKMEIEKTKLEGDLKVQTALAEISRKVQVLVDNMQQALFSVDPQGLIVEPVSKYSTTVFGFDVANKSVLDVVFRQLPRDGEEFAKLNSALSVVYGEGPIQWELAGSDIPTRVELQDGDQRRVFRIKTAPLWDANETLEKILFVVEDIGHLEELERLSKEHSLRAMALQEMADIEPAELRRFFLQFEADLNFCLEEIRSAMTADSINALMRPLHTLKGNAGTLRAGQMASLIHQSESRILEVAAQWRAATLERNTAVNTITELLKDLGEKVGGHRETARRILRLDLTKRESNDELTRLRPALARFESMLEDVARSLGKQAQLIVSGDDPVVRRAFVSGINDCLVHLLRNAADHGIESTAERLGAGKDPCGCVRLEILQSGEAVQVTVRDDGRGIDGDGVARLAVERGLLTAIEAQALSAEEKMKLIFRPGFSSKASVNEISGRGVGLDAVLDLIKRLQGELRVSSEAGRGTVFRLIFPHELRNKVG